jgi:hypothetical protein
MPDTLKAAHTTDLVARGNCTIIFDVADKLNISVSSAVGAIGSVKDPIIRAGSKKNRAHIIKNRTPH